MRRRVVNRATTGLAISALIPAMAAAGAASGAAPGASSPYGAPADRQIAADGRVAPQRDPGHGQVGGWRVTQKGRHLFEVAWTSPTELPVTDARPQMTAGDQILGTPTVRPDGRTLTLSVRADTAPDPADLDVVLSDVALDSTVQARGTSAPATYTAPPTLDFLGADPGRQGALPITSADYRLASVKLAGMPAKVEMLGHVVRPVRRQTTDPLVLLLHGRHEACFGEPSPGVEFRDWPCPRGMRPVPSYLGYDYMQRLLASQGYVTVSISANGINAQDWPLDDGGAAARAALVRRHLAQWARWSADGTYAVDMDDVVLVGHSRGGEGVDRVSLEAALTAPYRIAGQVLIAPTDFGRQTAAYIPTITILPYCDGDVSDLQGQIYTDAARDLTDDDTALHSSVLMMGANHNFFNSEWTPGSVAPSFDDWGGNPDAACGTRTPARLTAAEQRTAGKVYVAGAARLMAGRDASVLGMFDGSPVGPPASAGDVDVRTHAVGNDRDLRKPGLGSAVVPGTAAAQLCIGRSAEPGRATWCGRGTDPTRTPHWVGTFPAGLPTHRAFEMTWTAAGQAAGLSLAQPMDLRAAGSLDLRTIVDPGLGNVRLKARLYDESGASQLITPLGGGLVPALPRGDFSLGKRWAQTLRVPLSGLSQVDGSRIGRIDLEGVTPNGRIWVLDVAAVRAGLASIPSKRLPVLDVGTGSLIEGDGAATRQVQVPFAIRGSVEQPGRLTVLGVNTSEFREIRPVVVTVAPGQTSGTIAIPFTPDNRDDFDVQRITLSGYASRAFMTADYTGAARILDDDPTPAVTVRPAASTVSEGERVRWRVSLSAPVDYFVDVTGSFVAGEVTVPRLRVADLPASYVSSHFFPRPKPSTPLHRTHHSLGEFIPTGETARTLPLPVARDHRREGREAVSLRVRVAPIGTDVVRTVFVRDGS